MIQHYYAQSLSSFQKIYLVWFIKKQKYQIQKMSIITFSHEFNIYNKD
jgi:hypothetical protein